MGKNTTQQEKASFKKKTVSNRNIKIFSSYSRLTKLIKGMCPDNIT